MEKRKIVLAGILGATVLLVGGTGVFFATQAHTEPELPPESSVVSAYSKPEVVVKEIEDEESKLGSEPANSEAIEITLNSEAPEGKQTNIASNPIDRNDVTPPTMQEPTDNGAPEK